MGIIAIRVAAEEDERVVQVGKVDLNGDVMHPRSYSVCKPEIGDMCTRLKDKNDA